MNFYLTRRAKLWSESVATANYRQSWRCLKVWEESVRSPEEKELLKRKAMELFELSILRKFGFFFNRFLSHVSPLQQIKAKSMFTALSYALRRVNDAFCSDWLILSSTSAVIGQPEIMQFWVHVVFTTSNWKPVHEKKTSVLLISRSNQTDYIWEKFLHCATNAKFHKNFFHLNLLFLSNTETTNRNFC